MANNLGRISGQLLKDNLTRNGHDLSFHAALLTGDDPVLKLNVTNRYVSINTDSTSKDLFVNSVTNTDDLISVNGLQGKSSLKVSISGNTIVSTQDLNLSAATQVNANIIDTDNIRIDGRVISTTTLNTNLDLSPAGSLEIYNDLNVTGNLWAKETAPGNGTGKIILDGNITFGSTDQSGANADTISFAADINTDINPNLNATYRLGSNTRTWDGLYTELINGEQASTLGLLSSGVNLVLRPGKIWYVATNGLDSNVGNHQSSAFATIKHALNEAQSGDTVHIYPGTYTEITPLVVKQGVTVKGTGIRSVTVQPTVPTQSNNAFLLNGETTVSDLSVKDFYAPGCAFSFAPGFTVSTRSPYVQNITVITKGSVISPTDPRGFDEGDAGGGARVDGSLATSASKEASMLFHSVTFITPGVDALVMTNGVRVEWLNSFTYFANRGMYATNGTLGLASLGVRFGAEIRSIGSANVYGNYGVEANGASTLMYLIQHNFAYIGAGKDVTNDPSSNIAANETVELASGKIYYQSLDNRGNFKVGDAFGVSFDTGLVTINGVSVSAGGVSSINFANGTAETVIDAGQVTTGNINFSGNLLTTLSGAVNLDSGTNEINLNANTSVTNNLDIIGNLSTDGTLTIGNAYIDIVRFTAPVEFALRPKTDDDFTLGGPTNKRWDKVYLDTSYIGSYKLDNATISTLPTNADIELRANSTGKIYIPTNNVRIVNNLTVNGITNFGDSALTAAATVTGTIDHTGLLDRTGDTGQTGTYNQTGYIDVSSDVQIANVTFIDNTISTVTLDSNLELGAASTGKILIPSANVKIDHNLVVTSDIHAGSVGVSTDITTDLYSNGNIEISLDLITTTLIDSDLEFRAAGTGKVYASQDSVKFDQDLTVDGITALRTTNITGTLTQYGDYLQTGNTLQTGNRGISSTLDVDINAYFDSMSFVNNVITTTDADTDLKLKAALTGIIDINDNATFDQNLRVNSTTYTNGITNSGTITSDTFSDGDIEISTNNIKTTVGSNNLRLLAAGTGIISVPNDAVEFDNNLTVLTNTNLKNTVIGTGGLTPVPKDISLTGDYLQIGDTLQTGNRGISSQLLVHSNAYFPNVSLINNVISTRITDTDLQLKAVSTGIIDINDNAKFDQNLRINSTTYTNGITNSGIVVSDTFSDGDIEINSNIITTTVGTNDLRLLAAGTGIISVPNDSVEFNNNLTVNGTTSLTNTVIGTGGLTPAPKTLNLTGDYLQTGSTLQTGNRGISSRLDVHSNAYFDSMSFVNNVITTTDTNTDLSLKAAGTGLVVFDENTTFSQGLSAATLVINGLTNSGITTAGILFDNDIQISTNNIKTTVGNNNLRLLAAGTGVISVPNDAVEFNNNLTVNGSTSLKNTVIGIGGLTPVPKNLNLTGNYLQTGNTLQTGNRSISAQLLVRSNAYFDSMSFVTNTITTTDTNTDLSLKAAGTGLVVFDEVTTFSQSLTSNTLVTNGLTNSGTITSDIFTDGDIEINDNYITTTVGNNDLRLVPNGTGKLSIPLDPVAITQALTVQDTSILKNVTINGDVVHTGNTVQTGNVVQTGDFDLSTNLTVTGTDAFFTDVRIINNRIATSTGSNNLELRADGTAIIKIADSATFGQTLTVNGITTTSTISTVTGTITSDIFSDSDIEINDNYITTTVGNNNLILAGNTTGGPKLEKIKFNSNVISTETTNEGITLTVPTGGVTISAATALKIPVGTTVNRPILTQGEFRFNSTDNLFRGYSTSTVSFAGVYSADRRTSVLAHPTNNTLLFTTNTLNNMTVSSTGLTVNSLTVDNNLTFATNIISTAVTNDSLYLTPNGTGKVVIDDVSLRNNEIINSASAALVIQNTGNGYVRFNGTGGLALPVGPTVVDTTGVELGDLRYNTDLSIPEIFNGVDYVGFVSENAALLSAAEVQEITNLWALVIG